jgi:hypothetical protein
MPKPLTIIESPYAGLLARNIAYAKAAVRHSLHLGEAPFASHLFYAQPGILDDGIPDERTLGMEAGWEWMTVADKVAVYTDLGISPGMQAGIERAKLLGLPVEMRSISHLFPICINGG